VTDVRLWAHNVPRMELEFALTEDHLALLRRSYVMDHVSEVEYGAAWIDPKRPYGNSSVELDIAEILGWPFDEDGDLTGAQRDRARKLQDETPTALQIVLCTGEFRPGTYRRPNPYEARAWKLDETTS
jgi:hypothetical protein